MENLRASAKLILALAAVLSLACGSSSSSPGGTGGTADSGGTPGGDGGGGIGPAPDAATGAADGGPGDALGPDGTGGGDAGSVGASVAMSDFTQTFGTAYCQRVQQCCMPMSFEPESCLNEMKGIAELLVESYKPYLMSGKAVYRPEKAAACINALLAATCPVVQSGSAALNDVVAVCDVAFESTVPSGGACMDDLECNAGWCDQATKKCVAKKPDGAACEDDGDCLSDNCTINSRTCAPAGVSGLCR
jgi:hypothetical protein